MALALLAQVAAACAFHTYLPEETAVDRMLGSEHIVLVRHSPLDPFRYAVVEAIRGPATGVDIPDLVDSATRRRLEANADDRVLYAREGAYGPWKRLAYVDAAYRPVLDGIVARLESWSYGEDEDRFQFFADLLTHPDPTLVALAMAELDRAPYEILSGLRFSVEAADLLHGIQDPQNIATLPIRVLLLGLVGGDAARDFVTRQFAAGGVPLGRFAGAYAVALIEIEGVAGVEMLAGILRARPDLDLQQREAMVEALAIQSIAGGPDLGRVARARISALLGEDATLAGPVARQFGTRGDWSQTAALTRLSAEGRVRTETDLINVAQYLSIAKQVQGN